MKNGYISLVENASGLPASFSPGLATLSAVSGNVIAPFYSSVQLRSAESGCAPQYCLWDLSYSLLDLGSELDQGANPDYVLALRVTWGLLPLQFDPDDAATRALRPPGVAQAGSADSAPQRWVHSKNWRAR